MSAGRMQQLVISMQYLRISELDKGLNYIRDLKSEGKTTV